MLEILQWVSVVSFPDDLAQFFGGTGGGVTPLKTSGIGHLLFVGLYWTSCNRL